jgi:hypothetical protein
MTGSGGVFHRGFSIQSLLALRGWITRSCAQLHTRRR